MTPSNQQSFRKLLAQRRRVWIRGLQAGVALRLIAIFIGGWTVLAAADLLLALPTSARWVLAVGWTLLFALGLAVSIIRIQGRPFADFARYADRAGGARHPVLSSLEASDEISRSTASPFRKFLAASLLDEGARSLAAHPENRVSQSPAARGGMLFFLGCTGGVVLISLIFWSFSSITYPRVLFPWQDNPPYSAYQFMVHLPEEPVYYGDTAQLAVEIDGPPIREQVVLRLRGPAGESHRICFQETDRRFVQEIENFTGEVEVSFATGRARTRWIAVPVRYEPRVLAARLHVTPPAYTRLPPTDTLLRDEAVSGHPGTEIVLTLASNRPLAGGRLHLIGADDQKLRSVSAEIHHGTSARFRWTLQEAADLEIVLEDLRGSKSREPFRLRQRVIEDAPPEIAITNPPAYSLATPSSILNLEGYARDDLGLERVDFWRGLSRFRDRSRHLGPNTIQRNLDIREEINLARLGAEPGNVLEFYVQAADANPNGSAVTSNLVRVEVIDEETYAEYLRRELTIRDFARKMEETYAAIEAIKEGIQNLRQAIASGADESEIEARRQELAETMDAAHHLMETLGNDFPVFEVEDRAADLWRETAADLAGQQEELQKMNLSNNDADARLAAMLERWTGPDSGAFDELRRDAEALAKVNELMELAQRLGAIVEAQRDLVRRMDREVHRSQGVITASIRDLGEDQDEIREALESTVRQVKAAVDSLPETPLYQSLRESAMEVTTMIYAMQIPTDMQDAAVAGRAVQPQEMFADASRALEKLESLLQECADTPFGGMCNGNLNFSLPNLNQTLAQMMNSLLGGPGFSGRGGRGFGIGGGRGAGMGGEGGWMAGASALGVPMYGPQRSGFSPNAQGLALQDASGGRSGAGGPGAGGEAAQVEGGDPVSAEAADRAPRDSFSLENVPDRYRDATRRYFQMIE